MTPAPSSPTRRRSRRSAAGPVKWMPWRPRSVAAAAFFGAAIYLAGSLPGRARGLVRALAILGIVLVGLARIVLRAHWPSDVLAGIALGLALASLAAVIAAADPPRGR